MNLITAVAHIVAAVFAVLVLGGIAMWVTAWETERNRRQRLEETAITLGVAVDKLEREDLTSKLLQLSADRFSSELLRNRISDLCGTLRTAWGWLGLLLQIGVLVAVIWNMFSEGPENAVYAWSIVGITVFFWVASLTFSLVCRLLTGRFPGEAKQGRKSLADFLQQRHRGAA